MEDEERKKRRKIRSGVFQRGRKLLRGEIRRKSEKREW